MINFNKKLIAISILLFLIIICFPIKTFADEATTYEECIKINGGEQCDINDYTKINSGSINAVSKASACEYCSNPLDFTCSLRCVIIDIVSGISTFIIQISSLILNNILDGKIFAGYGFSPDNNHIIKAGWEIVRNVANAALVIGLVIIAITIILGRENKAKQTLIYFIIIALLINFTPVICEFIINGSTIITNAFVTGGVGTNSYSSSLRGGFDAIKNMNNFPVQIFSSLVFLMFSIIFSVILLLYALLFFARTIILWILVIVSPIAFATKVFPKLKPLKKIFPSILHWDAWWDSFWSWCFVGIPAGLSIYLANKMFVGLAQQNFGLNTITPENFTVIIIPFAIQYMVPFIFLLVGYFMSISSGTDAAKDLSGEMTNWAKRGAGYLGNTGAGFAGGVAGGVAGAGAWMTRDKSKDKDNPSSMKEYMGTGWKSGEATMQKEGVFGSALMASNKVVGGVAGGVVGAGKWVKRNRELNKQEEDAFNNNATDDDSLLEKLGQIDKSRKENVFLKSVGDEGRKAWGKGGIETIAEKGGQLTGNVIGAGVGAAKGLKTAIKEDGDITEEVKRGLKEGSNAWSAEIGTIAGSLGAKIGKAGRETTKEIFGSLTSKISEVKEEKKMTESEWEKQAKKKGKLKGEEEEKPKEEKKS
ncbi:hypothetical protein M0Q50_02815 [bacterium]|jgi:hypothetical protein|nr:hypothetical protein [bacterium]